MPLRHALVLPVLLLVVGLASAAGYHVTVGAAVCDQMSGFDKDVIYYGDQYRNAIDVHHGGLSYRLAAGSRVATWLDLGLAVEALRSRATADAGLGGTYDLDGMAVYGIADLVVARLGRREIIVGLGLGRFSMSGDIEAYGEPFDPEEPAGFEYTPATVDGTGTLLDVHAAVALDLGRSFTLRPGLAARLLRVSKPEVSIDDGRRPAGVDPRPADVPPAGDDFTLDYSGMVFRLELGYRF
ncbi:MAG: hypothetical protein R3D98_03825 [Candidatus Krumholzibacteriia bacterium]